MNKIRKIQIKRFGNGVSFILSLIIVSIIVHSGQAANHYQHFELIWEKTIHASETEYGNNVLETTDGDLLLVFNSVSNNSDFMDTYISKADKEGSILWNKQLSTSTKDILMYTQIHQISDNEYIIMIGNNNELIKIDGDGNEVWRTTYDFQNKSIFLDFTFNEDKELIIIGVQEKSSIFDATDVIMLKLDPNGDLIWNKTLDSGFIDRPTSIIQNSNGNYNVLVTSISSDIVYWLSEVDDLGNIIRNSTQSIPYKVEAQALRQTDDDGYCIIGGEPSNVLGSDIYFQKLNKNMEVEFESFFTGFSYDNPFDLIQTSKSEFIIVGKTASSLLSESFDGFLMQLDSGGNIIWNQTFGGMGFDSFNSVIETRDGEIIIFGNSESYEGENMDIWMLKFEPASVDEGLKISNRMLPVLIALIVIMRFHSRKFHRMTQRQHYSPTR